MSPACRPWISALDALKSPYPEYMRMFVQRDNLKHHLAISHEGQPLEPTGHRHNHLPHRRLYSPHWSSHTDTTNRMAVLPPLHWIMFQSKPASMAMATTNTSPNPILQPSNRIHRRLTLGKLKWTRKIREWWYITGLGQRSLMILTTRCSKISSITIGNT